MREINPKDVPQWMREGKLELGMELEFSDGKDFETIGACKLIFDGLNIETGKFLCHHKKFENTPKLYQFARFPRPNLRDGDPVVVGCDENSIHYKRIFKEYDREGNFVTWDDGYSRWTICEGASISHSWKYGRPATKLELIAMGYPEEHINEMMTRWGVTKPD